MKSRALVVASFLVLAGCGGGGGGSAPVPQPTSVPTNSPTSNYKNTATLKIVIPLPARPSSTVRNPQYVPVTSTTLTVTVNSVNGLSGAAIPSWVTPNPQTVDLTQPGICVPSGTVEICTVSTIPAPPGLVNYTFTVGHGANSLATFTGDETITQGASNNLNVTLQGIVKTVTVSGATLNANTPPASNAETLTVTASDADGNTIVMPGNYNNAITLTDNDASGITSLSLNGGAAGSTVTVIKPNDVVTLNYNGQAINGFTIGASGTGITGGGTITTTVNDVTFTGTTLDDATHGGLNTDVNWGQQTVFFAQASGTQTITAAELGYTNAPYSKSFTMTAPTCTGKATVTPGAGTTFTITALAVGICQVQLKETGAGYPLTGHTPDALGSPTHDGVFWISVTSAGFTVN